MTPKQQRFVEEYLIDLNATQAAIRAGFSAATAKQQGSRLLSDVDIRAAIERQRMAVAERMEVTIASITNRLISLADKAEALDNAPGMSVARQAVMDVAKINGLVVDTSEVLTRSPEERAARLAALRSERERLARTH